MLIGKISPLHVGIRRVRNDHPDFKEFAYKSVLKKMLSHAATDQEFTHNFQVTNYYSIQDMLLCDISLLYQLSSAYSGNIMPYTNYTFDFKVTKKHNQKQSIFLVVCCRVL